VPFTTVHGIPFITGRGGRRGGLHGARSLLPCFPPGRQPAAHQPARPRGRPPARPSTRRQFGSRLSRRDLLTWRGAALNALYWVGTRTLAAVAAFASNRGMAPLRRRYALPLGPPASGRSCVPMLKLDANSWLLEPPRPVGPPDVSRCRRERRARGQGGRAAAPWHICVPPRPPAALQPQPPPRSTPPPQVLIGPIAPRFARPHLEPPAAAAFVDSAPAGVAVVSFGSAPVFGTFLTKEDFHGLARAFEDQAPMRVLWLLKARLWGGGGCARGGGGWGPRRRRRAQAANPPPSLRARPCPHYHHQLHTQARNMPDGVTIADLKLADNTLTVDWVVRTGARPSPARAAQPNAGAPAGRMALGAGHQNGPAGRGALSSGPHCPKPAPQPMPPPPTQPCPAKPPIGHQRPAGPPQREAVCHPRRRPQRL
jgi:hypothetical protein